MDIHVAGWPAAVANWYLETDCVDAQESPPETFDDSNPGTITYPSNCGHGVESVPGIALRRIEKSCPLLAEAFEITRSGPRLHLDNLNSSTARPFVHFLQTGSYSISESGDDVYAEVPSSLLLHVQLYHLAVVYELPELKGQSNVNVIRQCEFGCSSPDKPIDLIEGIRYAYRNLRDESGLLNTIVSYCVCRFAILEHDVDFQQLAYDLLPFSQDLCRETRNREFKDEAAAAIIRMPFKYNMPAEYASRLDGPRNRTSDVVFHFHGIDEVPTSPNKRKRLEVTRGAVESSSLALALKKMREKVDRASTEDDRKPEKFQVCIREKRPVVLRVMNPSADMEDSESEDEDDGLTIRTSKTGAARIPEVLAAEAYPNASSGPLFDWNSIDQPQHKQETTSSFNSTCEKVLDFETQQTKPNTQGEDFSLWQTKDWASHAAPSAVRRTMNWDSNPGTIDHGMNKLWQKAMDNVKKQRLTYSPEDDDFLFMRTSERAAGKAAVDSTKEDRIELYRNNQGHLLYPPPTSSASLKGRVNRTDIFYKEKRVTREFNLQMLERVKKAASEDAEFEKIERPGSDSSSDGFEHVEYPGGHAELPIRGRDGERSAVPEGRRVDDGSGSPGSDWSLV